MSKKGKNSIRKKGDTVELDRSSTARMMRQAVDREASLVVIRGLDVGRTIPLLREQPVVIGRNPNCSVVVRDDGISWEHAEVRWEGPGRYLIRDLKSTNGVFVQGRRIETHLLEEGDKVLLGRGIILKFILQDRWDSQFQQQIYESAVRDALTGAFNRKYFQERLLSELSLTRRYKDLLSLLMVDIDHFKRINDTYGHLAGDQVLVRVSKAISDSLRTEDFFGRYGGEEFVVLARQTAPAGGSALGERLRLFVEEMKLSTSEGQPVSLTVSIGVVTITGTVEIDAASLVKEADKNLYRAKEAGRNQVVASEIQENQSPVSSG